MIVLAGPQDRPHVDKLAALFDIHAVLPLPLNTEEMRRALTS